MKDESPHRDSVNSAPTPTSARPTQRSLASRSGRVCSTCVPKTCTSRPPRLGPPAKRPEVFQITESFRGRIVDIQHENVMAEVSGTEGKVEAFIELMRPYGILELARTGRIALVRGTPGKEEAA